MSDDAWNFKFKNNSLYPTSFAIENISKTKVLAKAANFTVILEDLEVIPAGPGPGPGSWNEYKQQQLWAKGEPNDEGYFTLYSDASTTIGLTAISSNSLKLECKIVEY